MAFTVRRRVRFAHCDPAGIVFYPRYFEMLNAAVEDWCAEGLGASFRALHAERGVGLPAVRVEIDFKRPSRLGEVLMFTLAVREIRTRTASIAVAVRCGDELRLSGVLVVAYTTVGAEVRALPWPDELRAALARYAEG